LQRWYAAAARLGLRVRVLHPGQKWPANLKMIVAPSLQMVSDADVKQLSDYAASGGHLVLTCRTALMDRNGQMFESRMAGPILPLIGGQVEAYDNLPLDARGRISMDEQTFNWSVWGDLLYAEPRTRVLAKYADQFYAGAAAVIQSKFQKGTVTYCGVTGESPFINALMEKLAKQTGLRTTALPERVQVIRRGKYHVLLNYQDKMITAPAPANAKFVVGTRQVDPAGVAVWEQ
jgi:beta-galactosidase